MFRVFLFTLCFFVSVQAGHAAPKTPTWLELSVGIIGTATVEMLERAVAIVTTENYQGLLIRLDTPGGALEATRKIVQQMFSAPFPVVVWVGPGGAHAGSAGAFVTMAATVAAMAPGTNIGAAHPVQASGKDVDMSEKAGEKIINDTVAFIESIAAVRHRNLEMARSFVVTSMSITAEEALQHKIIDVLASSRSQLLEELHGREVTQQERSMQIVSADARVIPYQPSLRQEALELLGNPNLFYLLFLVGLIGLGFELTHPGALFPGILGAICMLLALISTAVLPVSFGAAALIVLGFVLLIAEVFVPSFGMLGIGGVAAFLVGSVFLVDPDNTHGLRVSWYTIAPGAVVICVFALTIGYLIAKSMKAKAHSGAEAIVGVRGTALQNFHSDGKGQVRVLGEVWAATSSAPHPAAGEQIEVVAVQGLQLSVKKQMPESRVLLASDEQPRDCATADASEADNRADEQQSESHDSRLR